MMLKKTRCLLWIVIALALLLVAGSDAKAAPPRQEADATLRIVNDSEHTICYVLISGVTDSEWGDNWLADDDIIPPGTTYSFDLTAGDYNVVLADCEKNVLLEEYGVAISGPYELGFTGAGLCDALNQDGVAFYRQARYYEALEQFQDALPCYRGAKDRAMEGATLNNIGLIYHNLGQFREALDFSRQALNIRQEIGDQAGEATTLNNFGLIYYSLGQYQEALDHYQEALTIAQEIGYRAGEGNTQNNIGATYERLGQYQKALSHHQQALTIVQEIGDRTVEEATLNNIGAIYSNLGQYQQALDYYQQALSIAQAIGNRVGEGGTLNNIGAINYNLGQYQEALSYLQQALSIYQEIGDKVGEGSALNSIGFIYSRLGQYQEALDYLEQASSILKEIGNRAGEGAVLHNIGFIYGDLGQYQKALDYYRQALSIRQEIGDQAGKGATLNNIGVIYGDLGQYQQALDYYRQALSIRQEIGDQAGKGATLNNIGAINYNLGQYQEALEYYQQTLTIVQEIGYRAGEGTALSNIGIIYRGLGQYQEALTYCEQAVTVVETMRSEMTVEEIKSGFVAEQGHVYDHIILLLIRIERPDKAFDYAQRAKARTFLDQLANVRVDPRASDDPELLAREQELLGEIHALENAIFGRSDFATLSLDDTTRGSPPPLTDEQRNEARERLEAAYRDYEHLLTQIKLTNPQYTGLRSVQASTLITVQQTLPSDVTLLEYYVAPDQTLAFVVTQDDFHAVPISVTERALNDAVSWFRDFPSLEGVPQASHELYDLLLTPIREHIHTDAPFDQAHDRLYIAPHGVLHYLPFGALHDGEHYLVEDYAIAYLPSASVLGYVLENARSPTASPPVGGIEGGLLTLANPEVEGAPYLNHAVAETEAVAALFDAQAIVSSDATETLFIAQAPRAGLVHVAAHGEFNPIAPQFSRIYLAPDDENDGYLEVREVFNLALPQTDLVTLSACETQLGELSAGDELVGLSRAFIYAGTPSLVASLWSVDDESTRFLMERFYGYLKEGQGKAAALRQAQLDTLAQEEWASPYYWAAFTLIGDMGEVEFTVAPDRTWLWIGGVALLLVVIGGGVWAWSRRR